MQVIALTDHDTVSGLGEAEAAASGCLTVIPGIELNTVWFDSARSKSIDVHVLGYYIDRNSGVLLDFCKEQVEARRRFAVSVVEKLNSLGVALEMSEIEEFAKSSPIGKIHITQAIVSAGGATSVTEAYNRFFSKNSPERLPLRKCSTPADAVRAIVSAGGVASLAHPGAKPHVGELVRELKGSGLGGIEVWHRMHSDSDRSTLLVLAERDDLVATGGSDCHGPFEEHESLIGTVVVPPDSVDKLKARSEFLASMDASNFSSGRS